MKTLLRMKHLIVLVVFLVLVVSPCALAAEGASTDPVKAEPSKAATLKPPKETRVSITGIVKEISDTMVMVERTVKGNTETMKFVLDKPVEQINAGDKVRVSYIKKDDKLIAIRVNRVVAKKIIKKASPSKEIKPLPAAAPPR